MADPNKVLLKHRHKPDEPPVEVENTGAALTPWMVKGYEQYRPPADPPSPPAPLPTNSVVEVKE